MQSRRDFLKKIGLASSLLTIGGFPLSALAKNEDDYLVILHTNDTHSRLEPFPASNKQFPNMGGIAARKTVIDQFREQHKNVLLVDAGDLFQGTPYFNIYKGEPEMKALSMLGYEAATMGNHEFDLGMEGFEAQLKHATFPFITSNYDFEQTILKGKTKPYHIIEKGKFKIGIIGLGVNLYGLAAKYNYQNMKYLDPIMVAEKYGRMLKEKHKCNMVVCISHLGYEYKNDKVSDLKLAESTTYIDAIIGGHTHTFLDRPTIIKNKIGKEVVINQTGWGGVKLGALYFELGQNNFPKLSKFNTVVLSKQTIG